MNKGRKFLSDLKLYSDFLGWDEEKQKYETWEEACESIVDGHRKKYSGVEGIEKELEFVLKLMKKENLIVLILQLKQ
jgi:hypothetical protein